jgi:hypothetical protein
MIPLLRIRFEQDEKDEARIEFLPTDFPDATKLDRLLRYETTLERNFDRTLSQLERLQRLRKGQPISPTVDVRLSTDVMCRSEAKMQNELRLLP